MLRLSERRRDTLLSRKAQGEDSTADGRRSPGACLFGPCRVGMQIQAGKSSAIETERQGGVANASNSSETNLPTRNRILSTARAACNSSSRCEQEGGSEKRSTSPGSQSANLTSIQQHARQAENGDPFRSCDWHGYPQAAGTGSERILHSQSSPRQFCCL